MGGVRCGRLSPAEPWGGFCQQVTRFGQHRLEGSLFGSEKSAKERFHFFPVAESQIKETPGGYFFAIAFAKRGIDKGVVAKLSSLTEMYDDRLFEAL